MPQLNDRVSSGQRLIQLDIIRGLAILGILLVNIFAFASPPDYSHSLIWQPGISSVDVALFNLQTLVFSGRFLTLFNLLFGVSLLLIVQKYGEAYLNRRLTWLAVFGLIHISFIWFGDILLWYALTGLLVLKQGYHKLDSAALWRKSALLLAISLIMPALFSLYLLLATPPPQQPLTAELLMAQQQLWTGPYLTQLTEMLWHNLLMLVGFALTLYWLMAALMMFGMALYKSGWFSQGYSRGRTLLLLLAALTISGTTAMLDHLTGYGYDLGIMLPWEQISALLMALAFASPLINARHNPVLYQRLQGWLAPCGRMAFTLYLSQSLLMVLLFKVLKPDWFASLDRLALLGIAVTTIILQLLFCRWYLQHYSQGPLEWLWRRLSKQPVAVSQTE
ncbi:uncharacterized protein SAMN06297280_1515 [Arsukibacterium tuosuense]|uniref:DUF418 domain-containing protein n=1 Tax=Arsukibacterium tuosuense TaxID=1323745 RepID=A0A285IP17_9GAMM|nr:DUF418 domain-containing protein [Arsukibacterium tuosuense]SNY49722.1 uncharacterized protein SAMN06297280_1515 [Arsukibacterium tuosuense]